MLDNTLTRINKRRGYTANGTTTFVAQGETLVSLRIQFTQKGDDIMRFKQIKMLMLALALTVAMVMAPVKSAMAATLGSTISGGEEGVAPGYSVSLSVPVEKEEEEDGSVSWSVSGATSPATSISSNGVLTIGIDERAESVAVVAVLNVDPAQIATTYVTVNYPAAPEPEPEILSVSMSGGATIDAGDSVTLSAKVEGTGEYDDGIIWSVASNTSAYTYITQDGVLATGVDEAGERLIVTATAAGNSAISASVVVNVTPAPAPEPVVTGVAVTGADKVRAGQSAEYRAAVKGENDYDESVTWSVSGNTSNGTSISANGALTVALDEKSETITVVATSNNTPSVSGSKTVSIAVQKEKEAEPQEEEADTEQKVETTADFTGKGVSTTTKSETKSKGETVKEETETKQTEEQKTDNSKKANEENSAQTKPNENKTQEQTKPAEQKNETQNAESQKKLDEAITEKVDEELKKVLDEILSHIEELSKEESQKIEEKESETQTAETENPAEEDSPETGDNNVLMYSMAAFAVFALVLGAAVSRKYAPNEKA